MTYIVNTNQITETTAPTVEPVTLAEMKTHCDVSDTSDFDDILTLFIKAAEVREALQEPITAIVEGVKLSLENTPPELAADIVDRGIVITGGGALLRGLDILLREETNLPINLVEDPLTAVVLGTGKILDEPENYEKVLMK